MKHIIETLEDLFSLSHCETNEEKINFSIETFKEMKFNATSFEIDIYKLLILLLTKISPGNPVFSIRSQIVNKEKD